MYPRLFIARKLLKESGVIFISIDDNELYQLKLLCDEVFGEENFVADFIRKTKSTTNDAKTGLNYQHEFLLCYAKNKENLNLLGGEKTLNSYTNPDNDPKGPWKSGDPSAKSGTEKNNYFEVVNPYTGKVDLPPIGMFWRFSKNTIQKHIDEGRICFKKEHGENERGFIYKRYLKDLKTTQKTMDSLAFVNNEFMNQQATKVLKEMGLVEYFPFPKGINFISEILIHATEANDIVLDFFAGSGTTAHAVMQLNNEDGGKRQFIMVQLPEETDEKSSAFKAGYQTIFDITKARIEKAAEKIKSENPDYQGDLGFKIFETVPDFREYLDYDADYQAQAGLLDFIAATNKTYSTEQIHTLLTTWRVNDGQLLTDHVLNLDLGGYIAYLCSKHLYLLNKDFDHRHIKYLLEKLYNDNSFIIERIIIHGDMVDSVKQQELKQAIQGYANKTGLKVKLLVRY